VAEGPFVGREVERAQVERAWSEVQATRRGGVVAVAGDGGIGKSRLAAEVAVAAGRDGAFVIAGPCDPGLGLGALWEGFVEMDRAQASTAPLPDSLDALFPLDEAVAHRYLDTMADLLTQRAETQPVMIVLDDLHAADDLVLLVVRRLVHRLTRSPILALATHQEGPLPATGVLDLWNDLHQVTVSERVALAGLPPEDGVALVEAWAEPDLPPPGAAARLVTETGGNPRYLIELTRHRAWGGVADGVPEPLRAFVSRRLDPLEPNVSRLVGAAAVVGPSFTRSDVERVAAADTTSVLDALDQAIGAGLVRETATGYAFATAVERQVVLDRLSGGRRGQFEERRRAVG
jgi:predicted ATPase